MMVVARWVVARIVRNICIGSSFENKMMEGEDA